MLITFHCAVLGLRMIQYSEPDGQLFDIFSIVLVRMCYHLSDLKLPHRYLLSPNLGRLTKLRSIRSSLSAGSLLDVYLVVKFGHS